MRSRQTVSARNIVATISGGQLDHISRRRKPFPDGLYLSSLEAINIAKTKDGAYWAEYRPGGAVFWATRWYEIPKTVGRRAEKINEFVASL